MGRRAYQLDDSLAVLLDLQREGGLDAGVLVLQEQEGLVRTLSLATVLGRQGDLRGVGAADDDGRLEGRLGGEPGR